MPRDSFNREIDYLRISVIDNCNLRCVYCMPLDGLRFLPRDELLRPAEIEQVVRAAVSIGFRKFRLTGGEPTLRARRDAAEAERRGAALGHPLVQAALEAFPGATVEAVHVQAAPLPVAPAADDESGPDGPADDDDQAVDGAFES